MELSLNAFVTLDGVMQGPGGPQEDTADGFDRGGWLVPFPVDAWGHVVDGWFRKTSAILLGRTTFEMMRGYWPHVTDPDNRVARILNQGKKYVVSTQLSDADAQWGDTTVIRSDVIATIERLKRRQTGELQVHGSWKLAQSLHAAGLVDVVRLLQFPVVVGGGKRFSGEEAIRFQVQNSEILPGGIVSWELRPTRFDSATVGEYAVRNGKETVA